MKRGMVLVAAGVVMTLAWIVYASQTGSILGRGRLATQEPMTVSAEKEYYKMGDTVRSGELMFQLKSVRVSKKGLMNAPDGMIYCILTVRLQNCCEEERMISALTMCALQDASTNRYKLTLAPQMDVRMDGSLPAGSQMVGEVAYTVPENTRNFIFCFVDNPLKDTTYEYHFRLTND